MKVMPEIISYAKNFSHIVLQPVCLVVSKLSELKIFIHNSWPIRNHDVIEDSIPITVRGNLVTVMTRLRAGRPRNRGSIRSRGQASRLVWGPHSLLVNGNQEFFLQWESDWSMELTSDPLLVPRLKMIGAA
jgi:hypothetical protein